MIHTFFIFGYNLLRIGLGHLRYGKQFGVHPLQRISMQCRIKLFGGGQLSIGRNTELAAGCDLQVHDKGTLSIGTGTYMNRYCMVSAHCNVSIGKRCMFGPGVKIFDNNHRFSARKGVSAALSCGSIRIGDACWIASDVIILKGAQIGDRCVIGAGCIISGIVPDDTLVKQTQQLSFSPLKLEQA